MNESGQLHLLAYDIADPGRLRAVARIAERQGTRIQYSVFILRLTKRDKARLLRKLEHAVDPRKDDIRLYPLPAKPAWELHGRALWPDGLWLSGEWPRGGKGA